MGTKTVNGQVEHIDHRVDVNSLEKSDASQLALNEIGQCQIALDHAIQFDPYTKNRVTGSFIIIDRLTNATVGAGMLVSEAIEEKKAENTYSEFELEFNQLVRKHFPHWNAKDISR